MGVSPSQTGGSAPPFASFRQFYPYYRAQHSNPVCRRLHVCGTLLALLMLGVAVGRNQHAWYLAAVVAGYLPAWVGHLFFQRNLPATFRHPLYSLCADFVLVAEVLTARAPW
jgi:hypothetical protein